MKTFLHVALVSGSRENILRFYRDLLGLSFVKEFTVSADLMEALFGLSRQTDAVVYAMGDVHFEIFLLPDQAPAPPPDHVCIRVESIDDLAEACRKAGLAVVTAPKGEGTVTFIEDFDHNRFELKEA